MKQLSKLNVYAVVLLAALFAPPRASAQAQPQAQARTYLTISVDVPFKFAAGRRTFAAGSYKFVVLGPGLLAVQNTKTRDAVRLITHDAQLEEVPGSTRAVFTIDGKGYSHLTSIVLEGHTLGLQIVGEEMAIRREPPQFEPLFPVELFSPQPRVFKPSH
jgi:hypothetical protein